MISDVLFSAVEQMDAYLDDPLYRDMYKGATRKELKALRALIDAARVRLDTPPVPGFPVVVFVGKNHRSKFHG